MLDKIIEIKKKEIKRLKLNFEHLKPSNRDFKKSLMGKNRLIAEIKKGSPNFLRKDFDLVSIAKSYEKYDIAAISVVTDKRLFYSDISFLEIVHKLTTKPILRKDFIIDEIQIYESRLYGADAILLIASLLSPAQIDRFIEVSTKLGMDCLVEVHTKEELKKVLKTKAEIIGINNRDLNTLKIDLHTTLELIKYIPKDCIVVSESGFTDKEDIKLVKDKVNAFLIGSWIMKSKDIEATLTKILRWLR